LLGFLSSQVAKKLTNHTLFDLFDVQATAVEATQLVKMNYFNLLTTNHSGIPKNVNLEVVVTARL
jgi:hypothetical protein